MRTRWILTALVLVSLPLIAMAAAQDAQPPEDLPDVGDTDPGVDPGVDTDVEASAVEELFFDEAFVYLERNDCPLEEGFRPDLVDGSTGWQTTHDPRASEDCVAQWGDGTYDRGSKAALEAPQMPTRHLAASNAPSTLINDAGQLMLESGVDPRIAAPVLAGLMDGCATAQASILAQSAPQNSGGTLADLCRETLQASTTLLEVPDAPVGLGGLFLELEHAYDFSDTDENNIGPDGAWVEIRKPGEPYKRLGPVALFAPAEEGLGTLCGVASPIPLFTDDRLRAFGIRASVQENEGAVREQLPEGAGDAFPSAFDVFPSSERDWAEDCGTLVSQMQQTGTATREGTDDAEDTQTRSEQRFSPYPGTVRGEGAGFVGSTQDASGNPQYVNHWFDLSPFAGETVEVRFVATGGAGLGGQTGGWWVDNVNLRYAGPPDDLSVRVETPRDGDLLPEGLSQITPGGMMPVDVVVENLGRTTSNEAAVEVQLGSASTNETVPALEPLGSHRVTAMLPVPSASSAEVAAELTQRVSMEDQTQNAPFTDAFPGNDADTIEVSFATVEDLAIRIVSLDRDGEEANVTVEIENRGNAPVTTPLTATLSPLDTITRTPRAFDAEPLGIVASATVPHGDDVNAFGVSEPTTHVSFQVTLPEEGIWQIATASTLQEGATADAMIPFQEATPTALKEPFDRVLVGPADEIPRGGFELLGQLNDDGSPMAFFEDMRHPISGPETRFLTFGDHGMASSGQESPSEWTPIRAENAASPSNVETRDTGDCYEFGEEPLDEDTDAGESTVNPQMEFLNEFMCLATGPVQGTEIVDNQAHHEAGLDGPKDARLPAALQAWHVRQNHVTIHGVCTETPQQDCLKDTNNGLTLESEDERVFLTFDHAANLNWVNERGAKAQVAIVPGGTTDLVEEMRGLEDQTRELTHDLGLPPEAQAIVNTVVMDLFFQNVISNTPETRLPQDVCGAASGQAIEDTVAEGVLLTLCGDAQIFDPIADQTEAPVIGPMLQEPLDFTDHVESTYLHETAEEGIVVEWEEPVPWGSERIDITSIVEDTAHEDGFDEGFYVMFNLVTTSNMDEVIASAGVKAPGHGEEARIFHNTEDTSQDAGVEEAAATFGWERGKTPLWTISDAALERSHEDDEAPRERWCLDVDKDTTAHTTCGEDDHNVFPSDMRGWEPYPVEEAVEPLWSYEQRGGDPSSGAPGALVWEGGQGRVLEAFDGFRTVIQQADADPHGVLQSPVVDLSGYETPVVEMNVQWTRTETGDMPGRDASLSDRCTQQSEAEEGTVWTRTGWNVRVIPVGPDGSRGDVETVQPVDGYDECSDVGDVPILFDGQAIHQAPHSEASLAFMEPTDTLDEAAYPGVLATGTVEMNCAPGYHQLLDPSMLCRPAELAFGHEEPVFGLAMPGWNEVEFDLSEYRGERVMIEVHAFGVNAGEDGTVPRGELRIDAFEVAEGEPPFDVRVTHDDRPFIPPDALERFELGLENRGDAPVEQVQIRRTVIGPEDCQIAEPVTGAWTLIDPATGQPGLPPGEEATIRNPQLSWEVPDDVGVTYERQISISTGSTIEASLAPTIAPTFRADGSIQATVADGDDCPDDVTIDAESLAGDVEMDEQDASVKVHHDLEDEDIVQGTVKVTAQDKHDVEALPAYLTPLPPMEPQPAFEYECDGLECTFDASPTRDPQSRIDEYDWDLGDGTTVEGQAPESHTYTVDDGVEETFRVELTITYGDGEQRSISDRVTVTDAPPAVTEADPNNLGETMNVVGHQLNQIADGLLDPGSDLAPEDVLRNGSVEAHVAHSAKDALGTGSAVDIDVDLPEPGFFTQLVIPCEVGLGCENGLIQEERVESTTIHGLAPGHYVGFVIFGSDFAFAPVEFTIEEEPETGTDARPDDNILTLRSEAREDPRVQIGAIDVPSVLPVGDEIAFPIEITNPGNVPLEDVTTDVRIEPLGLEIEADRIGLLDPGDTRTATATVDLPDPGPVRILVETHASTGEEAITDQTVDDVQGSGLVVVDQDPIAPYSGAYEHWTTEGTLQFGDGIRIPANANTTLPLNGLLDTATSPFSMLELNVSGDLELAYDGLSVEWRPADAPVDGRNLLVDHDDRIPTRSDGYQLEGQDLVPFFDEERYDEIRDRVGMECDPLVDTSDVRDRLIPIQELANPETYNCRDVPLGDTVTSSHAGGTPGETTPSLTGDPTLEMPGQDTRRIIVPASSLPGSTTTTVDTIRPDDWMQTGGLTLEDLDDGSFLDGNNAFYFPTTDQASAVTHQLRVPLTLDEWCHVTGDMLDQRTPFRIQTQERRLFGDLDDGPNGWDLNVRFESPSAFSTATTRTVFEDETTTDWANVEYEIPLGPLTAAQGTFPGKLDQVDDDSCEALEDLKNDLPPGLKDGWYEQEHRRSDAEIVFELETQRGPDEEALELGWFLSTIEVPELGIELGAGDGNHEAIDCGVTGGNWGESSTVPDARAVRGCTTRGAGSLERGSLSGTWFDPHEADLEDSTQRVQVVMFSGSSVTNDEESDPQRLPQLEAMLTERPLEADGDVLSTNPSRHTSEGEDADWFRYVDAVALVDLRAGFEGTLTFPIEDVAGAGSARDPEIVAQVVGTAVEPGEAFSEEAPSRVDWTPLGICDADPASVLYPSVPLGAKQGALIGPLDEPHTTIQGKGELCADIGPVAGEIAMIGIRLWLPGDDQSVDIGEGVIEMPVPTSQQLVPQLRAVTDDTVQEGTLVIHDVSILSMPPAFSHEVTVDFQDVVTWTLEDGTEVEVLESQTAPSAIISIQQPGLGASWEIDATITVDASGGTVERELDLDRSKTQGAGSQEIPVTWEEIKASIEWLEDEPVLPRNVTGITIDVHEASPETLEDPVPGCPSDLEDLAIDQDPVCRQLSAVVTGGNTPTESIDTELGLPEDPGIRSVTVTPDRASSGTPRTLEAELVNPTSNPQSFEGTLTLDAPGSGDPLYEEEVSVELDPWEATTLTLEVPVLDDEPKRIIATVTIEGTDEVEETQASDDYRTTSLHESMFFPAFFNDQDTGVERASSAAKPALAGQTSDGMGWSIVSHGNTRGVTTLATTELSISDVNAVLDRGGDPLFVFDHQRLLHGTASGEDPVSYMAVAACPWDPFADPGSLGGCELLETGWAPGSTTVLHERTTTSSATSAPGGGVPGGGEDEQEYDECTEEDVNQGASIMEAHGITPERRVIDGSTGVIRPDSLGAWETAAFEVPQSAVDAMSSGSLHFRIILGECGLGGSDRVTSEIIVDNVGLASARPVLTIGADEAPIWPGSEKRYRFTLENDGAGSDAFHITPSRDVPEGWHIAIDVDDETVFDTRTGHIEPVTVEEGEQLDALARVQAPGNAGGNARVPITAYAVDAPGLLSSAALHNAASGTARDLGDLTLQPVGLDLPDLRVDADSITVEKAEVGREANLQVQITNEGQSIAEDVPIAAAVRGPSGFETLQTASGADPVRTDLQRGETITLTYTWNPLETGEHTLRVVADPDPNDLRLLHEDETSRFFGLVQERQECEPLERCPNVVDHAFTVQPVQQPDLRLSVNGVPDRISIGDETTLEVIVENIGGQAATDAQLRLSENGLLPILDSMSVDLPRIEPGNQTVLTTTWAPVSPGEGLIIGSVEAPDLFTGQRPDGSSAGQERSVAIDVLIDRADVTATLSKPLQTEPGTAHAVLMNVTNEGTAPVQVLPETVREGGVLLAPSIASPVDVPPGEAVTVPLLGFAKIGTAPGSVTLPLPLSQGEASATVHVLGIPDARTTLEDRTLAPGTTDVQAIVTNEGNVPLDGELIVRGKGLAGQASILVAPGSSQNVTLPVTVEPSAMPGTMDVATHVTTDDGERVSQHDRLTVEAKPVPDITLRAIDTPLTGSATGELEIRNIGNEPLDGRAILQGPVSLDDAPLLALEPGEATVKTVTWISGTNKNGTAMVETIDGDTLSTTTLAPADAEPTLQLSNVETRPSVNLVEGMRVEVVATVENTGPQTLRNHSLGLTLDGELYQTFKIDDVRPGEVTTASVPIELPRGGELTVGMIDLAAFQRGETAGAATTIVADEATLGLSTMLEVPAPSLVSLVTVLALAAGVKRR